MADLPRSIGVPAMIGHGRDPDSSGQAARATTHADRIPLLPSPLPRPSQFSTFKRFPFHQGTIRLCTAKRLDGRFDWALHASQSLLTSIIVEVAPVPAYQCTPSVGTRDKANGVLRWRRVLPATN
jgi:hypothetical protein